MNKPEAPLGVVVGICALQSKRWRKLSGAELRNATPHGWYAPENRGFFEVCLDVCAAQCHFIATRHCERSARLAAALPGRFLPELGPSGFSRRPLFLSEFGKTDGFWGGFQPYSAERAPGGALGARKALSIRARRATNSPMSRVRRLSPAARVTRASSI